MSSLEDLMELSPVLELFSQTRSRSRNFQKTKVWCLHLSYFSITDKQKGKHVSYHFYIILIHLSETISLHEGLWFQKLQVWEKVVLLYFSYRVTHTRYWTEIKSRTRQLMFLFLILYKFLVLSTKFHFTCLLRLWSCPLA